jgi:uncharacterized peroxidase-related enzyme
MSFVGEPPASDGALRFYDAAREAEGYVPNFMRVWCWRPDVHASFVALRQELMAGSALTDRDWAVLVTATAAERGDSYCSLAWGARLSRLSDGETAAGLIAGDLPPALSAREHALAEWARRVVEDPNETTRADVERLRAAGLDDREIFEATAFVAVRLAFSTVNDALGAEPDPQLVDAAPAAVREAVGFGRAPASSPPAG